MSRSNISATFCEIAGANQVENDSGAFLKVCALIMLTTGIVLIPLSYFYFLVHRKEHPHLTRRNLFLITCFICGNLFLAINGSVRAFVGRKNVSCRLFHILGNTQNILIMISSLFRGLSLIWRVNYNKSLIQKTYISLVNGELTMTPGADRFLQIRAKKKGANKQSYYKDVFEDSPPFQLEATPRKGHIVSAFSSSPMPLVNKVYFGRSAWVTKKVLTLLGREPHPELPSDLYLSNFLASKYAPSLFFSIILVTGVFSSILVTFQAFPLSEETCFGCDRGNNVISNLLIVVTCIASIYGIYKARTFPDSLGIKREILVLAVSYLIILFFVQTPLQFFFADLETNGDFEFGLIGVALNIFYAIYVCPYQVWKTRKSNVIGQNTDEELHTLLESPSGSRAFALYLASNLTLENLYFYEDAKDWKVQHSRATSEHQKESARLICRKYMHSGAFLLINISYTCKQNILNALVEEQLPETLFDEAIQEIYSMMAGEIFPNFKKTSYYLAYQNEYQNEQ